MQTHHFSALPAPSHSFFLGDVAIAIIGHSGMAIYSPAGLPQAISHLGFYDADLVSSPGAVDFMPIGTLARI